MSSIVVADAGSLHYLVLIDSGEVLGQLFDHVLIPFAVRDELLHPGAPQKVKDWLVVARPWLEIMPVANPRPLHRYGLVLQSVSSLAYVAQIFNLIRFPKLFIRGRGEPGQTPRSQR